MKFIGTVAAFILTISLLPSPIEARQHKNHHRWHPTSHGSSLTNVGGPEGFLPHPSGCPRVAFCGCGVSVRVFGHPVKSLFLASNWFKFPRTPPRSGMVAVRNHHVMYIESYNGGREAMVYDPNSGGHQTRTHLRSLSGYVVVNPHGSHLAMR